MSTPTSHGEAGARAVYDIPGCVFDGHLMGTWEGTASERLSTPEGSGAWAKAFDDTKRKDYGVVVARELMALRRYSDAADMFEAASKGTPQAGQTLALVQVLRTAKPYEKTLDDKSFTRYVELNQRFHNVLAEMAGSGVMVGRQVVAAGRGR